MLSIDEKSRNTEAEREAPKEQVAANQRGNNIQEDILGPKCHWIEKRRHLAYNITWKWENEAMKAALILGGQQERDFMKKWKALKTMDKKRTFQIITSVDKL